MNACEETAKHAGTRTFARADRLLVIINRPLQLLQRGPATARTAFSALRDPPVCIDLPDLNIHLGIAAEAIFNHLDVLYLYRLQLLLPRNAIILRQDVGGSRIGTLCCPG